MGLRTQDSGWKRSELLSQKKEGSKIDSRIVMGVIAAIAIILIAFFVLPMFSPQKTPPAKLTNAQILKITSQESITKDFIARNPGYETKITLIDVAMLKSLVATSPAIYGDLNVKELYKIEYKAKDEGILLLLNPETQEIMKYYRVRELSF